MPKCRCPLWHGASADARTDMSACVDGVATWLTHAAALAQPRNCSMPDVGRDAKPTPRRTPPGDRPGQGPEGDQCSEGKAPTAGHRPSRALGRARLGSARARRITGEATRGGKERGAHGHGAEQQRGKHRPIPPLHPRLPLQVYRRAAAVRGAESSAQQLRASEVLGRPPKCCPERRAASLGASMRPTCARARIGAWSSATLASRAASSASRSSKARRRSRSWRCGGGAGIRALKPRGVCAASHCHTLCSCPAHPRMCLAVS